MKLNKSVLYFIGLLLAFQVNAQHQRPPMPELPKDYFTFPIKPGKQNYIAGSMGELRPNHFHGGIDIKTDGVINHPVYASADGYVCRVKVSTTGYGNVLYVRHPNNFVTVYAHLEKFSKPIADYVRQKQYDNESFDIELFPKKDELKVKKDEVLALSGNSGGSTGPHLHWEIRDTLDNIFNPLLLGFSELKDNIAPIIQKIAVKPLAIDGRVKNEFERFEFTPTKTGQNSYTISETISAWGTIGIELKAIDKMNYTSNVYGLETTEVIFDGDTIFSQSISFHPIEKSRYINHHIDYCTYHQKGQRFEKCYVDDGNLLPIYTTLRNNGKITIYDTDVHTVKINAYDAFGNLSTLNFKIKGEKPKTSLTGSPPASGSWTSDVTKNTLKIINRNGATIPALFYTKDRDTISLEPAYRKSGYNVYLYDLKKGIPDSVVAGNNKEVFNFSAMVPSGENHTIEKDGIKIEFPSNALFDSLYLKLNHQVTDKGKEYFHIHNLQTSLYRPIKVTIDPLLTNYESSNTHLYHLNKYGKAGFEGGTWDKNKIVLKTKNFGTFTFEQDSIAPEIKLKSVQGNTIYLTIKDEKSGIGSFRATLDGEWILMNYDHKRNLLWSDRLDKSAPLKGNFEIEVKDNAGNSSIFKTKL
ncbi:M23 family metallopeptidase [Cytophagaceae bacterium ABcell3]|nr:M23 family metallopeptidase [Cytophagaceae bacterium ABcell3]